MMSPAIRLELISTFSSAAIIFRRHAIYADYASLLHFFIIFLRCRFSMLRFSMPAASSFQIIFTFLIASDFFRFITLIAIYYDRYYAFSYYYMLHGRYFRCIDN